MEVKILSRKLVPPSSPTHPHLRSYHISAMDQAEPAFVYPCYIYIYKSFSDKNIAHRLERSLSEMLTLYYPLAGRFLDDDKNLVTCNDRGAEFVEAKVSDNVRIGQVLGDLGSKQLQRLVPELPRSGACWPLLLVKVSTFECGGVAIAVSFAHRVADGLCMAMFVNGWAEATRGGIHRVVPPSLELPSVFPMRDATQRIQCGCNFKKQFGGDFVQRRVFFSKDAIQSLRDEIGKDGKSKPPSRVAVVTAVLWRSFIKAAQAKHNHLRPSSLYIPVDMRRLKTHLPNIPRHSFGNFFTYAITRFSPSSQTPPAWQQLAGLFEAATREAAARCSEPRSAAELFAMVADRNRKRNEAVERGGGDVYGLSSWCGFPFAATDFGWGTVAGMGVKAAPVPVTMLVDGVDGGEGIDAWVSLQEDEMGVFEGDEDVLGLTRKRVRRSLL